MNPEEKLWRLRIRRQLADRRFGISSTANQIVKQGELHCLPSSQVRALAAALNQQGSPEDRLKALRTFFEKRATRKGEEKRWLKVVNDKTRLQIVSDVVASLESVSEGIVTSSGTPADNQTEQKQWVLLALCSYMIDYIIRWSEHERRNCDAG